MAWMPWLVLALLMFWAIGAYNRLVRLRSAVVRSFGALDTYLMRWIALFGDYRAAHAQTWAQTPAADAHAAVEAATTQFGASLAVARSQPLDGDAIAALATGTQVLDGAWQRLIGACSNAGDTLADELAPWARQREALRQQSLPAQEAFNEAVRHYNDAVAQLPANLLAWVFGFRKTRGL
ncbi:MAG: LemA family protein [Comamonadaceae bacterium]|nr:LemA family protein [Burkholderiales bacterium]MEB2349769.1 LemA family protein [Comamonadaceae bacterium]